MERETVRDAAIGKRKKYRERKTVRDNQETQKREKAV